MNNFEPLQFVPRAEDHTSRIVELLRGVYAEYDQVLELDSLDADLTELAEVYAEPSVFRVLLDGDRLIGTVAVKHKGPELCELKRVFLHAEYRKRGLGRDLVEWAFAWARERRYSVMDIWSDVLFEDAHAFYKRLGAKATGERRELGGVNDIAELYFRYQLGTG